MQSRRLRRLSHVLMDLLFRSPRTSWTRLAAPVLLIALALSLLGCGSDSSGTTVTPTEIGTLSPPPATPSDSPPSPASSTPTPAEPASPTPSTAPPTTAPPPDIGLLTPVDKQHGLPADYVPPDLTSVGLEWSGPGFPEQWLRAEAAQALVEMLRAARGAALEIRAVSGYRSYQQQVETFGYWVSRLGEAQARRVSAEPGHSEHQLGTAMDLSAAGVGFDLREGFGETPEGQWLAANAAQFGFVLSYPAGSESITGYAYEPWHFRFIGRSYAARLAGSGLTLTEFLSSLQTPEG